MKGLLLKYKLNFITILVLIFVVYLIWNVFFVPQIKYNDIPKSNSFDYLHFDKSTIDTSNFFYFNIQIDKFTKSNVPNYSAKTLNLNSFTPETIFKSTNAVEYGFIQSYLGWNYQIIDFSTPNGAEHRSIYMVRDHEMKRFASYDKTGIYSINVLDQKIYIAKDTGDISSTVDVYDLATLNKINESFSIEGIVQNSFQDEQGIYYLSRKINEDKIQSIISTPTNKDFKTLRLNSTKDENLNYFTRIKDSWYLASNTEGKYKVFAYINSNLVHSQENSGKINNILNLDGKLIVTNTEGLVSELNPDSLEQTNLINFESRIINIKKHDQDFLIFTEAGIYQSNLQKNDNYKQIASFERSESYVKIF